MSLDVTSWAFDLEEFPTEYTCDGRDVSPPLEWSRGPRGTRSYALIMDDPDGPYGTWVHWVAWNIRDTKLPRDVYKQPEVDTALDTMCQGRNSWHRLGYNGPCPPSGTHRYFIKIYALDTELDLGPDTTKKQLLEAMEGHILDQGELMGTYHRARALRERTEEKHKHRRKREVVSKGVADAGRAVGTWLLSVGRSLKSL